MDRVRPSLRATFLRLFTVQASWNYDRMLGVGVGLAEEPLLRDLREGPGDGAAYHAAVARGARFFNAHPYLCGLAVGATARAEHEGAPPEQIERLRAALCGPLGALGDRLVWAGWLPLLSVATVAAVAAGASWLAVAGFLLVYNLGHVALRWWALRAGWNAGTGVAGALGNPALKRLLRIALPALAAVSGVCLPLASRYLVRPFALRPALLLAAVGVAGVGLLVSRPGRITGPWLGLVAVATAVLVGVLWR